jgi:hypothetical protein
MDRRPPLAVSPRRLRPRPSHAAAGRPPLASSVHITSPGIISATDPLIPFDGCVQFLWFAQFILVLLVTARLNWLIAFKSGRLVYDSSNLVVFEPISEPIFSWI